MININESFKGKTALIMGSASARIGNHVANILAMMGMNIALHYKTSIKEAEESLKSFKKYDVSVKAYKADITKEEEIKRLINNVVKDFGKIDLLVNTAAAFSSKSLKDTTTKDLDFFYSINSRGTFLCAKYAGLKMLEQESGGVIINIADWAITKPYKNYSAYLASKGSIPTITKILAVELAPKVRVNYIMPGPILFPKDMPESEKQDSINKTLLKRQGNPDNIALAVMHYFLNDFITGDGCFVDGGRHLEGS